MPLFRRPTMSVSRFSASRVSCVCTHRLARQLPPTHAKCAGKGDTGVAFMAPPTGARGTKQNGGSRSSRRSFFQLVRRAAKRRPRDVSCADGSGPRLGRSAAGGPDRNAADRPASDYAHGGRCTGETPPRHQSSRAGPVQRARSETDLLVPCPCTRVNPTRRRRPARDAKTKRSAPRRVRSVHELASTSEMPC